MPTFRRLHLEAGGGKDKVAYEKAHYDNSIHTMQPAGQTRRVVGDLRADCTMLKPKGGSKEKEGLVET